MVVYLCVSELVSQNVRSHFLHDILDDHSHFSVRVTMCRNVTGCWHNNVNINQLIKG